MRTKVLSSIFVATIFVAGSSFLAPAIYQTKLTEFKATSRNGTVGLTWRTDYEENLKDFEIQYSRDSINYQSAGIVHATNSPTGNIYTFEHKISYSSEAFYRLRIIDITNHWQFSEPIAVPVEKTVRLFVYPSVITTKMITIVIDDPFNWMQIVSTNGTVMQKQNLGGRTGRIDIPLSPTIGSGMYFVQLGNQATTITQKIIVQQS